MTATIKTAATSKQVREPTHELSEDELNAVAGGWFNLGGSTTTTTNKKQAEALKGFQQALQELP